MSLTLKNVFKSYQQGSETLTILKDLSLQVETGELVAIVGASGSGKSTFLSLVAGLDAFDKGEISINQKNISSLNKKQMTTIIYAIGMGIARLPTLVAFRNYLFRNSFT